MRYEITIWESSDTRWCWSIHDGIDSHVNLAACYGYRDAHQALKDATTTCKALLESSP